LKRLGIGLAVLITIVLVIPAMVIVFSPEEAQTNASQSDEPTVKLPAELEPQIPIAVYRSKQKEIKRYPIEEYIAGVVAAEMPAEFEIEALKAQALAARTYIIRRLAEKDFADVPDGAMVTDTVQHQVFYDETQRRAAWGKDYAWKIQRIRQAVIETAGRVLTYQGRPIHATFFSTSNGYTENSEEYWTGSIPYLRSVPVPWDEQSPKYQATKVIALPEVERLLGTRLTARASTGQAGVMQLLKETTGNRVGEIKIGGKTFSGRAVREKLDLASSSFQWELKQGKLLITTLGYGHGVGMSQWGAQGMAQEGKTAEEIVKYFYQGIAIEDYYQWIKS
jgi:stage II sporulation protein D